MIRVLLTVGPSDTHDDDITIPLPLCRGSVIEAFQHLSRAAAEIDPLPGEPLITVDWAPTPEDYRAALDEFARRGIPHKEDLS